MSEIWSNSSRHQHDEQNWISDSSNLSSESPQLPKISSSDVSAVCGVLMNDFVSNEIVSWHSEHHEETRTIMKQCVSHLILQRKPDCDLNWISKLPDVAQRVEKQLYFAAKSIQEYSDPYTLIERLQRLVKSVISQAEKLDAAKSSKKGTGSHQPLPQQSKNFIAPTQQTAPVVSSSYSSSFPPENYMSSVSFLPFFSQPSSSYAPPPPLLVGGYNNHKSMMPPPPPLFSSFGNSSARGAANGALPFLSSTTTPQMGFVPLQQQQQQNTYFPPATASSTAGTKLHEMPQSSSVSEMNTSLGSRQVSCQGCSRVFIVKVLVFMSEHVKGKQLSSILTLKREMVRSWLEAAKERCCEPSYASEDSYFGGPGFIEADGSTYWSEPNQLFTWWKNNVERKSKFKIMQEDMLYQGADHRKIQRSRWCEAVVALADVIRTSSGSSRAAKEQQSAAVLAAEKISNAAAVMLPHALNAPDAFPATEALSVVRAVILNREQQRLQNESSASAPSTTSSVSSLADCDTSCFSSNPATPFEGDSKVRNPQFFSQSGLYNSSSIQGSTGCAYPLLPFVEIPLDLSDIGFPPKLFDLVTAADPSVVGWREDGLALVVRDVDRFVEEVLRKHFNHNSFATFQRQLNRHGFRRCSSADKGAYQHPQFLRGHREMAELILRVFSEPLAPFAASTPFLGNTGNPTGSAGYSLNYSQSLGGEGGGGGTGYNQSLYGAIPLIPNLNTLGGPQSYNPLYPGSGYAPPVGLYPTGAALSKFGVPFNPYANPSWNGLASNNASRYSSGGPYGGMYNPYSTMPMKTLPPRVVRAYKGGSNKKKPVASTASSLPQSAEQFLDRMPRSERYDHEEVASPSSTATMKKASSKKRVSKAALQHNLLRLAFGGGGDKQSSAPPEERVKRKYKTRVSKAGVVKEKKEKVAKKRKTVAVRGSDSSDNEREEEDDEDEAQSWMAQIEAQAALKTSSKAKKKKEKTSKAKGRATSPVPRVTAVKSGKSLSAKKQLLASTGMAAEIEEIKLSEFVRETSKPFRLPASKQSSADGTIEPFRPNYTTSGRNRLDRIRHRTSNTANVCDRFGVTKEGSTSVSVGVGKNHQAELPDLITDRQLAEDGEVEADAGLVWRAPADGDSRGLTESAVTDYLALTKAEAMRNPVAVGAVLVVFIEVLNAYRLCCVMDVHNADEFDCIDGDEDKKEEQLRADCLFESSVRVFDGFEEYLIPPHHCDGFQHRREDVLLQRFFAQRCLGDNKEEGEEEEDEETPTWSALDVKAFCSGVARYGDNIRKIWQLSRLRTHRSLPQVLEFFHRVYPHTQQGDSKRLLSIHHRAELASAGYPDGLDSSSSSSSSSSEAEEEEEREVSADGDDLVSLEDLQDLPLSSDDEEEEEEEEEEDSDAGGGDVRLEEHADGVKDEERDDDSSAADIKSSGGHLSQHTERDEQEKVSEERMGKVEKRKRTTQSVGVVESVSHQQLDQQIPAVRTSGRTKRERRDFD